MTRDSLPARWTDQATALEAEAADHRKIAQRDDDNGWYDMAGRNRRKAADLDTQARVLRECAKELEA